MEQRKYGGDMNSLAISSHLAGERRTEERSVVTRFYCVEICIGEGLPAYKFKLRDLSRHGMCILVKENSSVLSHLKVGREMEMLYHSDPRSGPATSLMTQIRHITRQQESGLFEGHCLIGLTVKDDDVA